MKRFKIKLKTFLGWKVIFNEPIPADVLKHLDTPQGQAIWQWLKGRLNGKNTSAEIYEGTK